MTYACMTPVSCPHISANSAIKYWCETIFHVESLSIQQRIIFEMQNFWRTFLRRTIQCGCYPSATYFDECGHISETSWLEKLFEIFVNSTALYTAEHAYVTYKWTLLWYRGKKRQYFPIFQYIVQKTSN